MPDLVGITLEEAQDAIEEAGFTEGDIEGGVGAGNIFPPTLLICEQDPKADASPKEGSKVDLVAQLRCSD